MDGLQPYGGSSVSRLTALINKDNQKEGREDIVFGIDFTFGAVSAHIGPKGENTRVILLPLPSEEFYDDPIPIHYDRLDLSAFGRLPVGMVGEVAIDQVPFSIHQILPQINQALGADLDPSEVEDTLHEIVMPRYALRVVGGASLAWRDSEYYFKADHGDVEIDLAVAIRNPILNGLVYVQPA